MDLTFTAAEEQFRAECRAWLEANVPRPALPSGDTREGFAAHLEWERTLFDARYAVVSWPEEYGGREAQPLGVADLRGGVLPRPARRSGSRRTASSCSRRRSSSSAPQEQKDRILPKMAAGEQTVVPGLVGAERGQRPRRHPEQGRARRRGAAAGGCPARRRGRRAARSARTCSACSAAIPTAERHHGLTYFLVDLATPGVTVRGVERLDGDEGFAEVFLDDVFVPDADVLGEPNQGWAVAMATTGSERGLTLRSPGPLPGHRATGSIDLVPPRAGDDPTRARPTSSQAWIDAEAYRWQTFWTVTRIVEGARTGRGVEHGQGVLVGARRAAARARARPARPARRAARRRRRGAG